MVEVEYGDELSPVLSEMGGLIVSEESIETTMQRIVDLVARVTPQAQAGITMVEGKGYRTSAATSDLVRELDAVQYAHGEGACLSAIATREMTRLDPTHDGKWPGFSKAVAERGVKEVTAVPLIVRNDVIGALNLYCVGGSGLSEDEVESLQKFAKQASVALHNSFMYSQSVRLSEQLQEALGSRAVIDQAKGILMEREHVSPDEAFEMLKQASQNLNIKVREIAQRIVDEALHQGKGISGEPG